MRKNLFILIALATLFTSCTPDELPTNLKQKSYSFEDVLATICTGDYNACIAPNKNMIAFIEEGFVFFINKGETVSADEAWIGASGVKKIMPYKENLFLALVQSEEDDGFDVYLISKHGEYARLAFPVVKDATVVGNDIYAIYQKNIYAYTGWTTEREPELSNGIVVKKWFHGTNKYSVINKEVALDMEKPILSDLVSNNQYPISFESDYVNFSNGIKMTLKDVIEWDYILP